MFYKIIKTVIRTSNEGYWKYTTIHHCVDVTTLNSKIVTIHKNQMLSLYTRHTWAVFHSQFQKETKPLPGQTPAAKVPPPQMTVYAIFTINQM